MVRGMVVDDVPQQPINVARVLARKALWANRGSSGRAELERDPDSAKERRPG